MDKFTKAYIKILKMNNKNIIKESNNDAWSEAADKISNALQSENEDIADEFLQEMCMDDDLHAMKEEYVKNSSDWEEDDADEPEVLWDIVINKLSDTDIVELGKKYQLI